MQKIKELYHRRVVYRLHQSDSRTPFHSYTPTPTHTHRGKVVKARETNWKIISGKFESA